MSTARSKSFLKIVCVASAAIILMMSGVQAEPYSSYQGSWIWQSSAGPVDTWMCFRKTVSLSSVPSSAIARIAADSKYWLWVNGQQVVFEGGLKRGPNRTDSWCDEIDLAPYLTSGQNCIAVQVWFWGTAGASYNTSGSGGLYFECTMGSTLIKSDNSWKALVHPAFGRVSSAHHVLPETPVIFNARSDFASPWYVVGFDDSQWYAAVDKGAPPKTPWGPLWKRPIPQWKNSGIVNYVNASALPTTSTGGDIIAKLPSNIQVTPYLKINASAGVKIVMNTDHGYENELRAEYTTKAGVQEWESPAWLNGENVIYTIPSGVQIQALKYRETGYNTEFAGSFTCNDAFLNTLWEKARRTVYVCMRDNFMDCPDRERAQWPGDIVVGSIGAFYGMDVKSHALAAKFYIDLMGWQGSDGVICGPVPVNGANLNELPPQSLACVSEFGIWNYYLHTGDAATIRMAYPGIKKYLNLWSMGSDGLIVHRDGTWDWFDWGDGCQDEKTMENAWYYSCMKAAIGMAALTGNNADIATWQSRKTSIENNFNKVLWNGTAYLSAGFTSEGSATKCTTPDDRANGLAVAIGLVDTTKWSGVAGVLTSTRNASPYMEGYALQALCAMGRAAEAQTRMKTSYYSMVNNNKYATLWENFVTDPTASGAGTSNHEWNAGVMIAMSGYMAGIGPDSAGYATYHVMPRMGSLTSIKATVASVKGSIFVSLAKNTDGFAMSLASPSATTAMVGIPRKFDNGQSITSISCQNQTVWSSSGSAASVAGVTFKEVNPSFVVFSVNPGSWKFTTGNAPVIDPLPTVIGLGREMPAIDPAAITINRSTVHITAPAGSQVLISGIDGRIIDRATLRQGASVAQFKRNGAGMYLYRIVDNSKRCIASGRFVVR